MRKRLNKSCENKMALKVRKSDNMQIRVGIPLLSVLLTKFRPLNTGQTDSFSLAGGSGILAVVYQRTAGPLGPVLKKF